MASAPGPAGVPPTGLHRTKRLKIDVACDTCRARKVKCDGVRPACGNCSKRFGRGDKCKYGDDGEGMPVRDKPSAPPSGTQRPPRPAATHVRLAAREPTQLSPRPGAYFTTQAQPSRQTVASLSPAGPAAGPAAGRPAALKPATDGSDVASTAPADTSPSVIDSMTAVVDEGVSTGEYFGSSSAGSFTAQIKAAIGLRLGQTHPVASRHNAAPGPATLSPLRRSGMHSTASDVLPPRRQADHLMGVYWFYVDPLYPFLDRRKWEVFYANLFAGTPMETDERIFVATLNVIFAMSTQLVESLTPEKRDETSNVYFRRAQDLLDLNLWDQGSLELVQYLLLTSQYLQSTNHPHQTWMIVGSAVRIAQGLGLHLPETSADQTTPARRELIRRVWHGCVLMDRMVSLTHGRPAMVSEHLALAVPLPTTSWGTEPDESGLLTEASFFVKSAELYEITHKVILAFYSGGPGPRPRSAVQLEKQDADLGVVMQLDGAMSKWEDSLPNHLVLSDPSVMTNEVAYRQAVILRIRFLHARMFLLRPVLARVCLHQASAGSSRPYDNLQNRVMQQCAYFCVDTAQCIIGLLLKYQATDGTVGLLPAWWYRVYYVFSAATVLIAAKLRADMFPPEEVNRAWNQAMEVLQAHEELGQSPKRCVAALQILASKIVPSVPGTAARNSVVASTQDMEPPDQRPVLGTLPQVADDQQFAPFPDLDLGDLTFEIDDFSWLNDMNAWGLLNE
ncbi:Fungal transcription factor [Tolypocladium paradoxum]|uniref:Fungal transcription factor n=1 Tax=Tolypocladium paradoxum TaxID=94208 RepID=A0A2S4KLI7_9HYPO|nr:Fungal transcription factor [Tolypocladium paradoxum]